MAHMIDETTGQPAIAYVGEEPWHGLGAKLEPGSDIETWRKAAGLDWDCYSTPVMFNDGHDIALEAAGRACDQGDIVNFEGKRVLYRSDTRAPLSVVGRDYQIVQPAEILDLFRRLTEAGGFELETAGALSGGKRVWGLARVSDGADIVNKDRVRPYLLLATSYDQSLATTAKFTTVRVVCHNTLSIAAPQYRDKADDDENREGPLQSVVRVPHSRKFDPDAVRTQLGIVFDAWERFQVEAGILAQSEMQADAYEQFLVDLLGPLMGRDPETGKRRDPRERRGFHELMSLYGGQVGTELLGATRWRALNAVTEYVDHHAGRSRESGLNSAWFGAGDQLKSRAKELLLEGAR